MNAPAEAAPGAGGDLLALYDDALPQVYGYLARRCDSVGVAEDLTAEVFLAAAGAVRRPDPPALSIAWLIGTARHKLADHWRRQGREQRRLRAVAALTDTHAEAAQDPWDAELDALRARETLTRLGGHHRAVLTLRYVDDLPVAEVARVLGRTPEAVEALLTRAKRAFRREYDQPTPDTTKGGRR